MSDFWISVAVVTGMILIAWSCVAADKRQIRREYQRRRKTLLLYVDDERWRKPKSSEG